MSKVKYITLGEKANFFHDPYSGITLTPQEVKEVSSKQLSSKKIKQALAQGHLSYTDAPDTEVTKETVSTEATQVKFEKLKAQFGDDLAGMAKKLTIPELKVLAEVAEVEVEEGDSKVDILKAILE